ncbi:MAG: aminotransferase class IV [Bacteroidales bacterium]
MSAQRFFLKDGNTFEKKDFYLPILFDTCIYEVVRVIEGVVLFAEDHVNRLFASLNTKGIKHSLNADTVLDELYRVVRLNDSVEGNIRYDLYINQEHIQRWVYYIPHVYPPKTLYRQGVKLATLKAERSEPSVKIFHGQLRRQVEQIMRQSRAYEVALVDGHDRITEGSKSNLFFIRQGSIITAPDANVLAGITRKKVIEIIAQLSIPLIYEPIKYADLSSCEAAFLTGTSPKILPIRKIDTIDFAVNHPFLSQLMQEYDGLIQKYIDSHKNL